MPAPDGAVNGGPRILVVLPYPMMARNFIHTGALARLAEQGPLQVVVVSPSDEDAVHASRLGMRWERLFHPRRSGEGDPIARRGWYARYLTGIAWRMVLTHRFNLIQGFRGFAIRLRQSWRLRVQFLAEALPMSRVLGWPLPRSRRIYRWLYAAYYRRWQHFAPVDRLFREFKPTLTVLAHLQTPVVTPYVVASLDAKVPILGINGSWDQPTTKGPLCPGLEKILVQNEQVREELRRHHDVPDQRIVTVGWPQMDPYADPAVLVDRATFLRQAGYGADERYIVFAANPGRLSHREPEIAAWLADRIARSEYGPRVRLHLRCHPNDTRWQERFAALASHPAVRIEPPRGTDLPQLTNLVRHAELVIASAGSMNLDAIALDTPTVGLAWEDQSMPYWDRQARGYEFEHLAAVAEGEGLPLARNPDELHLLVQEALKDRGARAAGRRTVRARFIEPLDGRASLRIAQEIAAMARRG